MKALCGVVALSICVAVSVAFDTSEPLEKDEIIEAVNSAKSTWVAGRNFDSSYTKNYVKKLLGRKKNPEGSKLPILVDEDDEPLELPTTFNAQTKWSKCVSLQQIRDQGPCGSCWAVAAAASFTDRLCIASQREFNGHLASETLLSCCYGCAETEGDGCEGGYEDRAWEYFLDHGIPTGGDYKSHEGCQPYELPTCEHHVHGKRKNCTLYGDVKAPKCKNYCYNRLYKSSLKKDRHKVKYAFIINKNVTLTQKEIYKHGPVEAGFTVYEDFLSYKSGVYQHTTGKELDGHAVKIIGWGEENGTPYWLVANSWNTDWGDKGYFKIIRGKNECGFEDFITGGYPVV